MSKIGTFLSVFILQNTNRCISYIINEILTKFWFMQRFGLTLINKYMLPQHLFSSDLTLHVHMYIPKLNFLRIQAAPQVYLSIPDTVVTLIIFLTHEVFSISYFFVSFTLLGGHCLYNLSLMIYFPILGEELIIASCKYDFIYKWSSAGENFDSGR